MNVHNSRNENYLSKYFRLAGAIGAQSAHTSPPGGPSAGGVMTSNPGRNCSWVKVDCATMARPTEAPRKASPDPTASSRRAMFTSTWLRPSPPQYGKLLIAVSFNNSLYVSIVGLEITRETYNPFGFTISTYRYPKYLKSHFKHYRFSSILLTIFENKVRCWDLGPRSICLYFDHDDNK